MCRFPLQGLVKGCKMWGRGHEIAKKVRTRLLCFVESEGHGYAGPLRHPRLLGRNGTQANLFSMKPRDGMLLNIIGLLN